MNQDETAAADAFAAWLEDRDAEITARAHEIAETPTHHFHQEMRRGLDLLEALTSAQKPVYLVGTSADDDPQGAA